MANISKTSSSSSESAEAPVALGDALRRVFEDLPDLDHQAEELRRMMRSSDDDLASLGLRRDKLHRRTLQPFPDA